MSQKKVKVIVVGPVNGRMDLLHTRVSKINASKVGPFDLVLCVGRFTPSKRPEDDDTYNTQFRDFMTGKKTMPVDTYFIVQNSKDSKFIAQQPKGVQVTDNLHFLGAGGLKVLKGLTVGYLCDANDSNARAEVLAGTAKHAPEGVDILLTNQWPEGILNFTQAAADPDQAIQAAASSSIHIQEVAKNVNTRYHFSASKNKRFVQRAPFRGPPMSAAAVLFTRFAAVAEVSESKDKKAKWLHALSLVPAKILLKSGCKKDLDQLQELPKGCTQNPFSPKPPMSPASSVDKIDARNLDNGAPMVKRPRVKPPQSTSQPSAVWDAHRAEELLNESNANAQSFFFGNMRIGGNGHGRNTYRGGYVGDGRKQRRRNGRDNSRQDTKHKNRRDMKCWFCLGNPDVETHLIAAVGTEAYLAMPKGALNDGHVLIIPISHEVRSLAASPPSVMKEIGLFKDALRKFFASTGRAAVFFERAIAITQSQSHAFVEAVPVPRSKMENLGALFIEMGSKVNIDFQVTANFDGVVAETNFGNTQYFSVELPDGTCLVHLFSGFNAKAIRFGRSVIASLLDCPERANWKACQLPKTEEEQLKQKFKRGFENFDPTEDDDGDDSDE